MMLQLMPRRRALEQDRWVLSSVDPLKRSQVMAQGGQKGGTPAHVMRWAFASFLSASGPVLPPTHSHLQPLEIATGLGTRGEMFLVAFLVPTKSLFKL